MVHKKKEKGTLFGILTPQGLTHGMTININKIKSLDPLAFAYGQFKAKSGQPLGSLKGLAPEYIRGYKETKKRIIK